MSTIDWAKLTAPVPQEDIEWVEKAAGRKFAYMSAQFVRRRLDAVALGKWSYECEPVTFTEGQPPASDNEPFVVKAYISLRVTDGDDFEMVTRSSLGSGKNFKEAETDAFKRAAQRLGIGNELYEMGPGHVDAITQRVIKAPSPAPHPAVARAEAAVKAVEAVRAEERGASAGDTPPCPICGGRTWDNREGKKNPKAPDFKCRDRRCDGVIWPPKNQAPAAPASYASINGAMQEDDDLAF